MSYKRSFLLLAMMAIFLWSGCGKSKVEEPPRPVRAVVIGDHLEFSGRGLPGQAEPTGEVNLAFRVSGPLIDVPVQVGDVVEEGDVLAQIDPTEFELELQRVTGTLNSARSRLAGMEAGARPQEILQLTAAVESAEASLTAAQSELSRQERLMAGQATSLADYERAQEAAELAESNLTQAQEALSLGEEGAREEDVLAMKSQIVALEASARTAENNLAYTTLKAPFSGVISTVFIDNFEMVQAQESIVRLLDNSRIKMEIRVPEQFISHIGFVIEVQCEFEAFPRRTIPATILEVGNEASRATRTYPVTLIMDQPSDITILPGMAGVAKGRVELPSDAETIGYEIPDTSLVHGEETYVWIIEDGVATQQAVEIMNITPRGVQVQGVAVGDVIATAGVHSLKEGQSVRILGEEEGEK